MDFLRTLFWIIAAVLGVIFSARNWTPVTVNLWSGIVVDTRLAILLVTAFLLGFVPLMIVHRAALWRFRRRLSDAQRAIAEARSGLMLHAATDGRGDAAQSNPTLTTSVP